MKKKITYVLIAMAFSGCASNPAIQPQHNDPIEPINRAMYKFNRVADTVILNPLSDTYDVVVPNVAKQSVDNFFGVFGDVSSFFNSILQGKGEKAANSIGRVVANITFGGLGLFDFASYVGIPKEKENFAQTLGFYGVPSGPYIVLPFLGPSSLRDGLSLIVDTKTNPYYPLTSGDIPTRNIGLGVDFIHEKNKIRKGVSLIDEASLDPYVATRDAYLYKMDYDISDGTLQNNTEEE